MNLNAKTYIGYLVILRLWIGYYLLQQGTSKFLGDFPHRDWVRRQIGNIAELNLFPWYKSFLLDVIAPNAELFGYLVTYGEILVGICLILGLLTRFSSAVGAFMMVNYILGPGMARGRSSLAQSETFFVAMIVLFLTNAGLTLGLDGLLFRRKGKYKAD
jgi:thiosulfate dehydrogenase [quinone] large subunit